MDRYYMIRSERTQGCCCGKCGSKVLGDRYNMRKHAQECGFCMEEEIILLEESSDMIYRLEDTPAGITLTLYRPRLITIPGFKDRFRGAQWLSVFEAEFPAGSRKPVVLSNETGLELETVLALIRDGRIRSMRRESDAEIIRRVFPAVIDVYSLQMFAHIYENKGFSAECGLGKKLQDKLFEMIPKEEEWNLLCAGQAAKIPLFVSLYRFRGDELILQVITEVNGEKVIFLFANGCSVCSRQIDLHYVLGREYFLAGNYKSAITRFDKECPQYHLGQYAERSDNILIPLLSADYHTGMELAAKSGAAGIAENYEKFDELNRDPVLYRNLKDVFGLPVSVLRALSREQACEETLRRIKELYAYNPAFVRFDAYTQSMMLFYQRANLTHRRRRTASRGVNWLRGIDGLSDSQILQILRYLEKHPFVGYDYFDYLDACDRLGEYPYGIAPRIPAREAHDLTVARLRPKRNTSDDRTFERVVHADEYMGLTTVSEEDIVRFKDDKYIVMAPSAAGDLVRESDSMHNCVRMYVPRVAGGSTRIYFLRKKNNVDKSFGTLEVANSRNEMVLWQAKAFGNSALDAEAQRFVIKWCRAKGIRINTWDIDTRYGGRGTLA